MGAKNPVDHAKLIEAYASAVRMTAIERERLCEVFENAGKLKRDQVLSYEAHRGKRSAASDLESNLRGRRFCPPFPFSSTMTAPAYTSGRCRCSAWID